MRHKVIPLIIYIVTAKMKFNRFLPGCGVRHHKKSLTINNLFFRKSRKGIPKSAVGNGR